MAISIQPVAVKILVAVAAASGTPSRTATGRYLLSCNTDCFIRFAGLVASVTAFDLFLPAGGALIVYIPSGNVSVIRDTVDGTLAITELE